jgi:uncharacterized protein DUF6647
MDNSRRLRQPHRHDPYHKAPRGVALAHAFIARVVLLSAVLSYAPARAETPQGCLGSKWIKEVAHFVAEETRSQVPEVCVRFAMQEQLNALVPSAMAGKARGETVAAVYVPATREILLADDLDPTAPLARSYLVHELVHAQQFGRHAHEKASCVGALEGEAYNLQALYLHTHSSQHREDAFLLQVLGMFQSTCGSSS